MSDTSEKRITEIMLFHADNGDTTTCVHYNLNAETLSRYKRLYRAGNKNKTIPRVLLLDIETAPMKVFSWTLWKPYLSHDNIIAPGFILSWAAKWLFSAEMMSDIVTPKEAVKGDDKRICESIWKLMDDANIIIAHNAKKFDIPWLNAEFFLHGMNPPMPYQVIDTLLESRKHFRLPSHRLDYLGKITVRKEKLATDFGLWIKCMAGDKESLDYMLKYNKEDVLLLESVYVEQRAWVNSHPNMSLYFDADGPVCPNCGSVNLLWENKYYVTMVSKFAAYRCKDCGAICRCRTTALSKKQRKNLLVSTAR